MNSIKNIIFDLGGVLYAIDYQKIESGMASLQLETADSVKYSRSYQDPLFTQLEIGSITPESFWQGMKNRFQLRDDRDAFFKVWNSMLYGLIPGRQNLVHELTQKYRVFLLSNTNIIHYQFLITECEPMFQQMEHCYFSHEVGMRKPEPQIFKHILQAHQLLPQETLFIEDSEQHIEAAKALGIQTIFVQSDAWPDQLHNLLSFSSINAS
jgi:FMN phosphatase YigB (HAD superfamily)